MKNETKKQIKMSQTTFELTDYDRIVESIENDSEFHDYVASFDFGRECDCDYVLYFLKTILEDDRIQDSITCIDVMGNVKKILTYLNSTFPLTDKADINSVLRMDNEFILRLFIICCLDDNNKVINCGSCIKAMLEIDDLNPTFLDIYFEYFDLTHPFVFEAFVSSDGFRTLWDRFLPIKDDLSDEQTEIIDEFASADFRDHMDD